MIELTVKFVCEAADRYPSVPSPCVVEVREAVEIYPVVARPWTVEVRFAGLMAVDR